MPQIEPSADDAALRATLRNALQDELAQMPPDAGLAELHMRLQADTVVLGCTHYPLVADALQALLGPGVLLLDTADAVARRVASLLDMPQPAGGADLVTAKRLQPALRLLATAHPVPLERAAQRWLGHRGAVQLLQLPGDADPGRA